MGNPLKSEGAAFRWLIAVLIGAGLVIAVTELFGSAVGASLGFILIVIVSVFVIKGLIHMLGSPDDDASESDPSENDTSRGGTPEGD